MDDEQYQHFQKLLRTHQRRLRELEQQAALKGSDTPPHIRIEIEDLRAELARLERELAQVAPSQPSDSPTPANAASVPRRINLPAQATAFIGREEAVADVCVLLRRDDVRLVTLSGPGGIGKTRLAIQVATELRDDFADGVWFVALAPIADTRLIPSAIVQSLGVQERGDQPLIDQITAYLRDRHLLLLLDNVEHLAEGVAPLIGSLLSAAPGLKLLVTSRTVLHVYGEREVVVPPLPLPDPAHLPSLDGLLRNDAVRLFVERAQAVRPDFALTDTNAAAVAHVCHRLDGLPLAIELAAARSKMLTPAALLARLDTRLKLLTGGASDAPARQQTLRSTIDWSYNLLAVGEQTLFAHLAVFVGGCTLEAAEAVLSTEDGGPSVDALASALSSPSSVLDGLASLVDKSLLRQQVEPDGELRFTMLETIREYALERFTAQSAADATRRKHMQYYLGLAQAAEPHLFNEGRNVLLRRLAQELDNLRAALRWCLSGARDRTLALQLANALGSFWYLQGRLSEGRAWFEAALSGADDPTPLRAQALTHLGILLDALGNFPAALECFEASLAIFRAQDDRAGIAGALDQMSHVALLQGDYERANALAAESLAMFRLLNDRWHIALSLERIGATAVEQGFSDQGTALLEECIAIARQLNAPGILTGALNVLGMAELERGDNQRSLALFQESLAILRPLEQKQNLAWTLRNLGLAELATGAIGDAAAHFGEALSLYRELESEDSFAIVLEGLSGVAAAQHQPQRCAQLLGAATAIREAFGMPLSPNSQAIYRRMLEAAQAQLAPAEWEAELARGRAMSLEQAIAYAIAE